MSNLRLDVLASQILVSWNPDQIQPNLPLQPLDRIVEGQALHHGRLGPPRFFRQPRQGVSKIGSNLKGSQAMVIRPSQGFLHGPKLSNILRATVLRFLNPDNARRI
jgi:hypothetical protein